LDFTDGSGDDDHDDPPLAELRSSLSASNMAGTSRAAVYMMRMALGQATVHKERRGERMVRTLSADHLKRSTLGHVAGDKADAPSDAMAAARKTCGSATSGGSAPADSEPDHSDAQGAECAVVSKRRKHSDRRAKSRSHARGEATDAGTATSDPAVGEIVTSLLGTLQITALYAGVIAMPPAYRDALSPIFDVLSLRFLATLFDDAIVALAVMLAVAAALLAALAFVLLKDDAGFYRNVLRYQHRRDRVDGVEGSISEAALYLLLRRVDPDFVREDPFHDRIELQLMSAVDRAAVQLFMSASTLPEMVMELESDTMGDKRSSSPPQLVILRRNADNSVTVLPAAHGSSLSLATSIDRVLLRPIAIDVTRTIASRGRRAGLASARHRRRHAADASLLMMIPPGQTPPMLSPWALAGVSSRPRRITSPQPACPLTPMDAGGGNMRLPLHATDDAVSHPADVDLTARDAEVMRGYAPGDGPSGRRPFHGECGRRGARAADLSVDSAESPAMYPCASAGASAGSSSLRGSLMPSAYAEIRTSVSGAGSTPLRGRESHQEPSTMARLALRRQPRPAVGPLRALRVQAALGSSESTFLRCAVLLSLTATNHVGRGRSSRLIRHRMLDGGASGVGDSSASDATPAVSPSPRDLSPRQLSLPTPAGWLAASAALCPSDGRPAARQRPSPCAGCQPRVMLPPPSPNRRRYRCRSPRSPHSGCPRGLRAAISAGVPRIRCERSRAAAAVADAERSKCSRSGIAGGRRFRWGRVDAIQQRCGSPRHADAQL
jgi:hypothetical protein